MKPVDALAGAPAPTVPAASPAGYFSARALSYPAETAWIDDPALVAAILDRVPTLGPGRRALDLAAGPGTLTRALAQHRPARWHSLDLELAMLTRPDIVGHRVVADGAALPLRPGVFSAAVCRSGLHYIGLATGLREMARVVAPGGTITVAQKVADGVRHDFAWYAQVQALRSVAPRQRLFSEDIVRQAEGAGLALVDQAVLTQEVVTDLHAWASRSGFFTSSHTARLLELAAAGSDPTFAARTGFAVAGRTVRYLLRWAVTQLRVPGPPA
ncbi:MAG TPA: class I SAM-dependent methyltransferase [Iamia sp.]